MGEIYVPPMGRGGVGSDELTATKAQVLTGFSFVGSDTNDEAGTGTMRNHQGTHKTSDSMWIDGDYLYMSISDAGYYDGDSCVYRPATDLGNATPDSVLASATFTGPDGIAQKGNIVTKTDHVYNSSNSTYKLEKDDSVGRIIIRIPVAYYKKYDSGSYPAVCVDYTSLASLLGIIASKIGVGNSIMGINGGYKGLGDAAAADVLAGKKFSTASLSNESGTMVDKSGTTQTATATLDATNKQVQLTVPATAKYSTASKLQVAYATLASLIGLTAAKLISGNTILGIAGTATGDATISGAAQLRKGVIAYGKNGMKYTGTMTEKGAQTYTPGTSAQTIAANQYLTGVQTIAAIPSSYVNITGSYSLFKSGTFGALSGGAVKGYRAYSTTDLQKAYDIYDTQVLEVGTYIVVANTSAGINIPTFAFKKSIKFQYYKKVRLTMINKSDGNRRVTPFLRAINSDLSSIIGTTSASDLSYVSGNKESDLTSSYLGMYADIEYTLDIDISNKITSEGYFVLYLGRDTGTDATCATIHIKEITLIP